MGQENGENISARKEIMTLDLHLPNGVLTIHGDVDLTIHGQDRAIFALANEKPENHILDIMQYPIDTNNDGARVRRTEPELGVGNDRFGHGQPRRHGRAAIPVPTDFKEVGMDSAAAGSGAPLCTGTP
jgi:hypothetical protein